MRLVLERTRVEEQLRQLNNTLEARVEARTRELQAAETARREADTLYRSYFEHSPDPLFVIGVEADGGFVVEQVNPAHEAGVGFRLEEVRGRRVEEFLPHEAAERVIESYRRVTAARTVLQYRETFQLAGEPQHWDTTLVPLLDAEARVTRIIGASRNVTRQVVAEEALRQSQKMEAMGQLTGGVAHDFNNLLTPILGVLDRLQGKGLGDERDRRLIGGALQSAERARTLVQRLLSFARRQPLQLVPVDVGALVEGMAELITSTVGPSIRVSVDSAPGLPPAMADANQLEMALLNLSVNARDAMAEGGRLTISVSAVEAPGPERFEGLAPGSYIRLCIADTGVGMDQETQRRAIEPFFSTKGVGQGTGLGLSMAHGLAAQLGGALTIDSAPGQGTSICLLLPQGAAAAAQLPAPVEPVGAPVGGGTVLLVDDDDLVRTSIAQMLADLGYQVVAASAGEEALALLGAGTAPDLLITDHLMPGMTGTELARRVAQVRPGTPTLVISGYADLAGIDPDIARLAKPFRQTDLVASLAALRQNAATRA